MTGLPSAARVAVLLLAVAGALLLSTPGTLAAFTDGAQVRAGTAASPSTAFTSGQLATPASPSAAQNTTTRVTLTWTATPVGTLGGTAASYDVIRYDAQAGGTSTPVCSNVATRTCVDTAAPAARSWYAVRARVGDNWTKEGQRTPYDPDVSGPVVVIVAPLNNQNTCTAVACGTAADPAGVAKVEYTLRRTRAFLGIGSGTVTCWNGTGFTSATNGSCEWATATGTTSWTVPGARSTAYAGAILYADTFLLTVRATDALGNTSASVTATYTP